MSKEENAFENLEDLAREFLNLDGQEIHNAIFPLRSVINNSADEAKKRYEYEEFLKTHMAAEEDLENFASEFLADIIYKHLNK
jgi:hypothetical protein